MFKSSLFATLLFIVFGSDATAQYRVHQVSGTVFCSAKTTMHTLSKAVLNFYADDAAMSEQPFAQIVCNKKGQYKVSLAELKYKVVVSAAGCSADTFYLEVKKQDLDKTQNFTLQRIPEKQ